MMLQNAMVLDHLLIFLQNTSSWLWVTGVPLCSGRKVSVPRVGGAAVKL